MSVPTRQQRLQGLLARLKPFEHLHRSHQIEILAWRNQYARYNQELRACLHKLAVPQLEPYLVWIPPDNLRFLTQFAEGGFAKVYQAYVEVKSELSQMAAKEMNLSMVEELVLNVYLSYRGNDTNNTPTMDIVALSQHPRTKEYLMIMEFADIGTLEKQPCEQDGDWYTAFTYAIKLANRLAILHDMGFSHKDLHPGNVVFDKSHTALLIDVGLSQAAEDANSEKGVYGRMAYFPPEIFKGEDYTKKSDVYCLGTLLWQLIVGVPPQANASAAVSSSPDGLREELIHGAPTTFNDILRSCWHIDPNRRPRALDVYYQLLECAAGLVGIPFNLQPNIEHQILGALATTPMPFSFEIQSFIKARRIIHQQQELEFANSINAFEFKDGRSAYNAGSKFYSHSQLSQITNEHSRLNFLTPMRDYCSIEDGTIRKNKISTNPHSFAESKTNHEGTSILVEHLKQEKTSHILNLSGKFNSDKATHILIEFLKQNTEGTILDLSKNRIGILLARAFAEILKQNKTLTTLNFQVNSIGAEGAYSLAESLKKNTTLTELNLAWNSIGDEGTRALAESLKQNTTLKELNLGENNIADEGAHALAKSLKKNMTLTGLNLSWNRIGDEGTRALAESLKQNTTSTEGNFSWNSIDDVTARVHTLAESLKQKRTLAERNISGNNFGNDGAHTLTVSMKQNAILTELNLERNNIGDEGARALAESLKENTILRKLNLGRNNIGDEGACALAGSLKQNTTLPGGNLYYNDTLLKGENALAESLKKKTTLTELNLFNNSICDKGARALAESLKKNETLIELNLCRNSINVEGGCALAESLKWNKILRKLNLERNSIGDEGACAMAESLKLNRTLTELNLNDNNIDIEGARALAESLEPNKTLIKLDLENNSTGQERARVKEYIKRNKVLIKPNPSVYFNFKDVRKRLKENM